MIGLLTGLLMRGHPKRRYPKGAYTRERIELQKRKLWIVAMEIMIWTVLTLLVTVGMIGAVILLVNPTAGLRVWDGTGWVELKVFHADVIDAGGDQP